MEAALLDNIHIHAAHAVDPRITHSLQLFQQLRDGRQVALNFHLHTSVIAVPHPPGKPQLPGFLHRIIPETDALDAAVKINVFSDF